MKVARDLRRRSAWVYKTDIASYFDSIPRDRLHAAIRRAVKDRSLHELLFRASTCEIEKATKSRMKRIEAAGIRLGVGVRQGMPLSPFFANLMLKRFDASIEKRGVPMVRYADDLICFANSKEDCERIHGFVKDELEKDLLTVPNPGPGSKTAFSAPDEDAEFLGLSFRPDNGNYLLEVSSVQTAGIKKHLLELADVEHLSKLGVRIGGFFRRLDGAIAGYEGAYGFADNANHVSKVLQDARAAAIRKLFQGELGISIASLSDAKKRFIGLIE